MPSTLLQMAKVLIRNRLHWLCCPCRGSGTLPWGGRRRMNILRSGKVAHETARALGLEKAQALLIFYASTACHTVSCFAWHTKWTAWAVWTTLPELTQTITDFSTAPDHTDEDVMPTIERFIILIYDRTSIATDIDKARCKLFGKKRPVHLIPPTIAALKQHVQRVIYQGGHDWDQAPTLPSPTDWGLIKTSDIYKPLWTSLP